MSHAPGDQKNLTAQPTAADEPAAAEEPKVVDEPMAAEEPKVVDEPAAGEAEPEDAGWGEDTIVAVSTATGLGAIGIVRMSGPGAISIAESAFHPARGMPLDQGGDVPPAVRKSRGP